MATESNRINKLVCYLEERIKSSELARLLVDEYNSDVLPFIQYNTVSSVKIDNSYVIIQLY